MWKECNKCKKILPFYEFNKHKNGKFGIRSECKICTKKYSKKYHKNNKEKELERKKEYYKNNKEKELERKKVYNEKNEEKLKIYRKEYYKNNEKKIKKYGKEYHLKSSYGINSKEKNNILEKQNYKCAICNNTLIDKTIHIDHDHNTGKIRELLCSKCNTGLGHFNDDIDLLENAIKYLKKHKM